MDMHSAYPHRSQHDTEGRDFLYSLYQSRWSSAGQGPTFTHSPALNPADPAFQSNGMGLDRYQVQRPDIASQSMINMQRSLVDMNKSLTYDYLRANRRADENAQDIAQLRSICQRDFGLLEKIINELGHGRGIEAGDGQTNRTITANQDYTPSPAMHSQFRNEHIAHAYLDTADEKQAEADKLREQAELLCPGITEPVPHVKAIQAAPESEPMSEAASPGHACCNINFFSLLGLLKHVDDVHAKHDSAHETPTCSTPAVLAEKPNRPHAVEINASTDSKLDQDRAGTRAHQDTPVLKDPVTTSTWCPHAIASLQPFLDSIPEHDGTFSFDFIRVNLGGDQGSPGFYFDRALPSRGYWIVDAEHEPFLPKKPGGHGAKLTAFFNDTASDAGRAPLPEDYINTPVFIKSIGENGYKYFGHYSQLRFSDRVSYDVLMEHVPEKVRHEVATQLSERGRPRWVTNKLMEHFWPKPIYEGPRPTDSICNTPATSASAHNSNGGIDKRIQKALEEYALELKVWEKDAHFKVNRLTTETLMSAFQDADSGDEPGLRLWWEYLQCVGYNTEFYDMLVQLRGDGNKPAAGIKRPPTPRWNNDNSTDLKRGAADVVKGRIVKTSEIGTVEPALDPSAAVVSNPEPAASSVVGSTWPPAKYTTRKPQPKRSFLDNCNLVENMPPTKFVNVVWDDTPFVKTETGKPHERKAMGHTNPDKAAEKIVLSNGKKKAEPQANGWEEDQPATSTWGAPTPAHTQTTADKGEAPHQKQQPSSPKTGWQGAGDIEAARAFSKEVTYRNGNPPTPKPEPSATIPRPHGSGGGGSHVIPPHRRAKRAS